jgi:GT2 family glycosyltransferase
VSVSAASVGVVVTGRNHGERLLRCLDSVRAHAPRIVYVDGGSGDGSIERARERGVPTIVLDTSRPATAARARNAGWQALAEDTAAPEFVQFLDADCELAPRWLRRAAAFLEQRADVAAVCGRLHERFPEASIYNRLRDAEWDAPPGQTRYCGGNAMLRLQALRAAGGFRDELVAGEEPELCVRLTDAGWHVWRLRDDMGWHDAAMKRFSHWWQHAQRTGYAFAEGARLHGRTPHRHWVRETHRAWWWAGALPLSAAAAIATFGAPGAALLGAYPLQFARRVHAEPSGDWRWDATRAGFELLSRFAELSGQGLYWRDRWRRRRQRARERAREPAA